MPRLSTAIDRLKSRPARTHFGLLSVFTLVLLNFFYPTFRFSEPLLNNLFVLPVLGIPAVLVVNGLLFESLWAKVINGLAFGLFTLLLLWPLAFVIAEIAIITEDKGNSPTVVVGEIPLSHSTVVAYCHRGNATTAPSVDVRQEISMLPGILMVRRIYFEYPRDEITLDTAGQDAVMIDGRRYVLSPLVYF